MYAQTNYQEKMGNGQYTIAEVGCFLTAFCNLLERYRETVAPDTLNKFFIAHGSYIRDPDGANEDLTWNSISHYDSTLGVARLMGAGWPPANNAIVEFRYVSPNTHEEISHFCLVEDFTTGTIVDSWDGKVKKSPYGTPIASAIYTKTSVTKVTPQPQPTMYTVKKGDTLGALATKFGSTVQNIINWNKAKYPLIGTGTESLIQVGWNIRVK